MKEEGKKHSFANNTNENHDDTNLYPGLLYFYSESFAFSVNGICAFLASLMNFGLLSSQEAEPSSSYSLIGYIFIVLGGIVQFLAALRSFRANEHFGATALGVFSALWFLLGLEMVHDNPVHLLPKLLMATFAVQSVLLLVIAPFLNGYFTCLMGAISATVIIETVTRFHADLDIAIRHAMDVLLLFVEVFTSDRCFQVLMMLLLKVYYGNVKQISTTTAKENGLIQNLCHISP